MTTQKNTEHYVLVDFENVQPDNLSLLNGGRFKVKVFLGKNQTKISVETARALQALGSDAEYIQIEGNGKNALDFHIAYYIGRLAAEAPESCFYIISGDSGFGPLVKHLNAQKVECVRCSSIAEIPGIKTAKATAEASERVDAVIRDLVRLKASRPRTITTLRRSIKSQSRARLEDDDVDAVVNELVERGVITVTDQGRVTYHLPQPEPD